MKPTAPPPNAKPPLGHLHLLLPLSNPINEIHRILPTDNINTTGLIRKRNPIALLRYQQHFRTKRGTNELASFGEVLNHLGDGGAVLGV
jgi:hypothetical protein